jgi:phenol 2-monooxygenase
LTSTDLLTPSGTSSTALVAIAEILSKFPSGIIELVVLHPLSNNTFVWTDLPDVVKTHAEMRFYNSIELEDAYKVYSVDPTIGAVSVVRPDGYVGIIAGLEKLDAVHGFLKGCLKEVGNS